MAQNSQGTEASVEAITLNNLKEYYNSNLTPKLASLNLVGDISQDKAISNLETINQKWETRDVAFRILAEIFADFLCL
ncbi:MAG: insulinase family protein [Winogradskyella sp.]|uniref:insulinase family protein n=1 Tax=Winogradskyella sp. TaxID=1883156 RepID=UPI00179A9474|nr:insulinase family protein [Winogradskyella sp.]NNK22697.1 insulinase family protein [Winogradskyella sp.]